MEKKKKKAVSLTEKGKVSGKYTKKMEP